MTHLNEISIYLKLYFVVVVQNKLTIHLDKYLQKF